jgi:wyosine [tRNA(Phe)-imidazoG37] synthetase (radical SAM superfamily)
MERLQPAADDAGRHRYNRGFPHLTPDSMDITFGPVPSRRLGRSLGINHIPPKHCSYSCRYCQVGPTQHQEIERRTFYTPEEVFRDLMLHVEALREQGEAVDFLTFVPDGEPALDIHLGATIDALRPLGLPIAVISNASLIWREDVRADLAKADWVSLKVDSVDPATWRALNQPHPDLQLDAILAGIRTFAGIYGGTLASETMLVAGVNDDEAAVTAVADFLASAGIRLAYLAIPHRPPADSAVSCPDESVVTRAWHIFQDRLAQVELLTDYEGDVFSPTGDPGSELLAIAAVHPLRESAVQALLARAGADRNVVEELLRNGSLRQVDYAGESFYIRQLRQE